MALQFVDQSSSAIGNDDRRMIRSHVMRGKNVGKKRAAGKKQRNTVEPKCLFNTPKLGYVIPRQVLWGDLCLTSFPQELDSESKALLHRWFFDISDSLFPPQFCTKFDIIKSIWVNCILVDEAYFHSTLAISASYVDFARRKPAISSKTLHHISQAYALVNTKLSGPFSVSDIAIAAVVSLTIYQQVHGQPATGLVHLRGLYRMIELRGGIARLMQENRALALKPLRLDVELAMQNGTRPLFQSDEVPVFPVLCGVDVSVENPSKAVFWMSPIMSDLLNFSMLLNEAERKQVPKVDPIDYTETMLSLLYRIVEASPLLPTSTKPRGLLEDVANLVMLGFMTTLLPEYTRDGTSRPLLCLRLESNLHELYVTAPGCSEPELHLFLWFLFTSGVSVLDIEKHPWLSSTIANTCERLGLDNWAAIEQQLSHFPWIFALHEDLGSRLWEHIRHEKNDYI